jgi:histidyl-tRNA synthetase
LNETNAFPSEIEAPTKVLFINFGIKEQEYLVPILQKLRKNNISAEIYPEHAKIKRQMTYANQRKFPIVIIAGANEIDNKQVQIKNMKSGEQILVSPENILEEIEKII